MITVTVVAPFEVQGLDETGALHLPEGASVFTLLRQARAPLVAYAFPVSVNSELAGKRRRLRDGDRVVFIAPISGG